MSLEPGPSKPPPSSSPTSASLKHLFVFVRWRHSGILGLAIVTALLIAGCKTALSIVLGKVFDIVAGYGSGALDGPTTMSRVAGWCIVLCGLGGGACLANAAFLAAWVLFGEMQARAGREDVFASLMEKEVGWYDAQADGISSLLVRTESQTRELQLATSQVLGLLVSDTFGSAASLGIGLYYSWKLALVLLATVPVSFGILSVVNARIDPAIREQQQQLGRASRHAVAAITAIDLVKVFGGHDQEVWQYLEAVRAAAAPYLRQACASSAQLGYLSFWIVGLFVVGFWYGAGLVDRGSSPGAILTTFYATLNAFQSLEAFMPQWLVVARGMAAGRALGEIVADTTADGRPVRRMRGSHRPAVCLGDVEMFNVSFAYPSNPSEIVLQPSTFHFPAGEMTFLVGRSGSGKSTIADLLVGFYESRSGQISLDGHPLQILDRDWLRANVMLVQQSSVLFRDTFFANVALGLPGAAVTSDQVRDACESAVLQSTVAGLPRGLDTTVGPGGHDLSGGQRQRLALARARLRNPPVLILDEVTSGLDQTSRTMVVEALRQWRHSKTTIIITHDVSQVAADDYVYVLDGGRLVQAGVRRDLSAQSDGLFASLARSSDEDGEEEEREAEKEKEEEVLMEPPRPASPRPPPSLRPPSAARRISRIIQQSWQAPASANAVLKHASFGVSTQFAPAMKAKGGGLLDAPPSATNATTTPRASTETDRSHPHLPDGDKRSERGGLPTRPPSSSAGSRRPSFQRLGMRGIPGLRGAPGERIPEDDGYDPIGQEQQQRRGSSSTAQSWKKITAKQKKDRAMSIDFVEAAGNSVQASRATRRDSRITRRRLSSIGSKTKKQQPAEAGEHGQAAEEEEEAGYGKIFGTVWPALASGDRCALALGVAMCLVVAGANPAFSYCFAQLLQAMWQPGNRVAAGQRWALILLLIAVVDGGATFLSHYLLERAGLAWVNTLRVEALKRILRQPHGWFHEPRHAPGRIGECLDRNGEEMRNLVGRFLPAIVTVAAMVAASVGWAMAVSWRLTLIALAPGPLLLGAVRGFGWVSAGWEATCNRAAAETSAVTAETLTNIRVVRTLAAQPVFAVRHASSAERTYSLGIRRALNSSVLYGAYQSTDFLMIALVFYFGTASMVAAAGALSTDRVIQVINLLLFGIGTATGILSTVPQMSAARAAATDMLAYTGLSFDPATAPGAAPAAPSAPVGPATETQTETDTDPKKPGQLRRQRAILSPLPVRMRDLTFAYPSRPDSLVLRGVNLEIGPGTCTAIVGPSGCGKSTVASLLLGVLHPPLSGAAGAPSPLTFAGGVPHGDVEPASLRGRIGFVPQTPFLFPATVEENILYGLPETSRFRAGANAERAARAVGMHEYVASLPEGYGTVVGEGGLALSGGQAQRLSIARAVARRPLLLVMDEPTSALDGESAETVRAVIRRLAAAAAAAKSRPPRRQQALLAAAIVVVTHSREMMRTADRVVMLAEGRVVEEGPYDELVSRGGGFASLMSGGEWRGGGGNGEGRGEKLGRSPKGEGESALTGQGKKPSRSSAGEGEHGQEGLRGILGRSSNGEDEGEDGGEGEVFLGFRDVKWI